MKVKRLRYAISKILWTISMLLATALMQFGFAPDPPEKTLSEYYSARLNSLDAQLEELGTDKDLFVKDLRQLFEKARMTYKSISLLTEYYNQYETKQLNGAAIKYVEDDNPQQILLPHGFQVIEEKIFSDEVKPDYDLVRSEIVKMQSIVKSWIREPLKERKFTGPMVFEALQYSMIRLMAMGITGFDSPVAKNSVSEAESTMEGMQTILRIYQPVINVSADDKYEKMMSLLQRSSGYLHRYQDFNSFDRLTFITDFMMPAYSLLVSIKQKSGLLTDSARKPFNTASRSIFDSSFFNINFFSPNERFRPTKERINLGRKLFYDPVLSGNKKRSCASCHKPELAFTDGLPKALAVDGKKSLLRNTPILWNSALQTKQFFDSRVTKLENQLSDVLHNEEEMKGSLKESAVMLQQDKVYSALFGQAYAAEKEKINQYNIANAISSYIRSLVLLNSRFDQYMLGNRSALSTSEKKGFNLFMGKAKCGTCHFMPLFNGLVPPEFTETESEVLGVPATKDPAHPFLDTDIGRYGFTQATVHRYAFKTPTLRNIALTAPYMHNGVFSNLEEVMDFYNKGGGSGLKIAPENQTLSPDKLDLSKRQIRDIIAFMKSLTSVFPAN